MNEFMGLASAYVGIVLAVVATATVAAAAICTALTVEKRKRRGK